MAANSALIEDLRKQFGENPRRVFARLANEYRKAGDLQTAIEICRSHVPLQPTYISGYIVLGQALFESGQLDEARATFETALGLDPENLIALRQLGDIARVTGDIDGARAWYHRLLEVDPQNDEIAAQLANLEPHVEATSEGAHEPVSWSDINPETQAAAPAAPPAPEPSRPRFTLGVIPEDLSVPPAPLPHDIDALDVHIGAEHLEGSTPSVAPPAAAAEPMDMLELPSAEELLRSASTSRTPSAPPPAPEPSLPDISEFALHDPGADAELPPLAATTGEFGASIASKPPMLDRAMSEPPEEEEPALEPESAAEPMPGIHVPPPPDRPHRTPAPHASQATPAAASMSATPAPKPEPAKAFVEPARGEIAPAAMQAKTAPPQVSTPSATPMPSPYAPPLPTPPAPPITAAPLASAPPARSESPSKPAGPFTGTAADDDGYDPTVGRMIALDSAPAAEATPATFVTETMAELYLQQGFHDEALNIYRQLLSQRPDDAGLKERVAQLERGARSSVSIAAQVSEDVIKAVRERTPGPMTTIRSFFSTFARRRPSGEHDAVTPAAEPTPAAQVAHAEPAHAASVHTESLHAEPPSSAPLADPSAAAAHAEAPETPAGAARGTEYSWRADVIAAHRVEPQSAMIDVPADAAPKAVPSEPSRNGAAPARASGVLLNELFAGPAPSADEEAASTLAGAFSEEYSGPVAAIPGQPTRAASDALSLDDVFRAERAAGEPRRGPSSVTFDEFFAPRDSGGVPVTKDDAPPASAGEEKGKPSDLELFHAWLDGLKK